METIKVEIELPKEAYELAKGLGAFGAAVKAALADGWQIGQDMPVIITAAVANVVPALEGASAVTDEAKLDPVGFGQALAEGLKPIFKKA